MSLLGRLFGAAAAQPIEAVGNVLDTLFTSDDEKLSHQEIMARLAQRPGELQVELNKLEAQHRSVFVAGWRPFIGWVCGVGLSWPYLFNPIVQWITGVPGPEMPTDSITTLVFALLGLGGLRTVEKLAGRSR